MRALRGGWLILALVALAPVVGCELSSGTDESEDLENSDALSDESTGVESAAESVAKSAADADAVQPGEHEVGMTCGTALNHDCPGDLVCKKVYHGEWTYYGLCLPKVNDLR